MRKFVQGYFRKTVFQTIRYFKHPRKLKKSPMRRWFSRHFLNKRVWKPTQHTFAAGLAIGMFFMIQLIPGQMFVAALLAALFRVNIPIAVIACWISNPFTFLPFSWLQHKAGEWVMPYLPAAAQHWINGVVGWLVSFIHYLPAWLRDKVGEDLLAKGPGFVSQMYVGGMVIGAVLCVLSYPLSWFTWEVIARFNKAHHEKVTAALLAEETKLPPLV